VNAFRWILASVFFSLSLPVFAGQSGNIHVSHYEPLQRLSMQSQRVAGSQKITNSGPVRLSFDALGKSFDLQLESNRGFLSAASRNALPDGIGIYRGSLAGNAGSWARIVVFEGMPRGFIWDGNQMYAIEAPGDSIVETNSPVIYRLADTFIEPGTMSCGSESLSGNGAAIYGKVVGELGSFKAQGAGAVSEIDIGAVGDSIFTNAHGGDAGAIAAITDRLNRVDGIFSQEIAVQINVPTIETFSDPALDPFTSQSNPSLLLDEVVTYRQGNPAQSSLGLTHLWTGRDLDGTTVGIAYNGVLCRPNVGAGLSEGNNTPGFDSLVAAHEIGHNFGAPHDGVPGACESVTQPFIMAPMLNGTTQFSQCSIDIMRANVALAACVTALPTVDMSVALNGQSPNVLLGANTVLTYDVSNNGLLQATDVLVDVSIPTNLTVDSIDASFGDCMEGAGTVNCVLGDVPGLSDNTVTITTTPTTVGVGTLTATVTADVDVRSVNNQDSLQLTVDPAVDLLINSPASVLVALDQSATITAVVENRAVLDATGVSLSISFGNGVRVDSASWASGSCAINAQQIDCQAANLARQSNSTLTVGLTGLTTGSQSYGVSMSSNEADADPLNNSLNGTVTVSDPADEGGGGTVGLVFLWMLSIVALLARRRLNHI